MAHLGHAIGAALIHRDDMVAVRSGGCGACKHAPYGPVSLPWSGALRWHLGHATGAALIPRDDMVV